MPIPENKECKACHVTKPAGEFHKKAANPDGLQLKCKACTAGYRAAYHAGTHTNTPQGKAIAGTIIGIVTGEPINYDKALPSPSGVDTASEYQSPLDPSRASPNLGEGGTPEKEKDKSKLQSMLDAAIAQSEANPKDETDQVAFRERQQSERLTSPASVSSTSVVNYPTTRFADLPHAAIMRSKTNPRTHFDRAFLQDLAANIAALGILQPILVRPLPGNRIEDSLADWIPGTPRPTHEIVAGEQRWRAAGIAGLRTVPAMIRELGDEQVLEIQLVENLKRRDLHALEEAEGYERLLAATGLTVEQVAERIGRKRTYVYNSLSLLRLIPEARAAFYDAERKLTRSVAELIARHTETLQPAIMKDVLAFDHLGEPMSFRKAREHIANTYTLQLAAAPFKTDDEALVPAVGSCVTCPLRSGSNPDLFGDFAQADTCTNPPCYANKKTAHYERLTAAATARGQTVIVGKEAREIMPDRNTLRGYTRVDEIRPGEIKSLRGVLGEDLPSTTLIEDPQSHELIEVLPTAEAGKLLRERAGKVKKPAKNIPEIIPEPTAADLAADYENAWRHRAIRQIAEIQAGTEPDAFLSTGIQRQIALVLVASLQGRGLDTCADLANVGAIARRDGLADHMRDAPHDAVAKWLYVLTMAHDLQDLTARAERIEAGAQAYGIKLDDVRRGIKDTMKATAAEKAGTDNLITGNEIKATPPARPGRPPRIKKTIEQFNSELVDALRNAGDTNVFKRGEDVRIRVDLTRDTNTYHTRGMPAEILEPEGDRAWRVKPEGLNFPLTVDYTEIEPL
jgi:ParB/RepB/Spo0J family partition protein